MATPSYPERWTSNLHMDCVALDYAQVAPLDDPQIDSTLRFDELGRFSFFFLYPSLAATVIIPYLTAIETLVERFGNSDGPIKGWRELAEGRSL